MALVITMDIRNIQDVVYLGRRTIVLLKYIMEKVMDELMAAQDTNIRDIELIFIIMLFTI